MRHPAFQSKVTNPEPFPGVEIKLGEGSAKNISTGAVIRFYFPVEIMVFTVGKMTPHTQKLSTGDSLYHIYQILYVHTYVHTHNFTQGRVSTRSKDRLTELLRQKGGVCAYNCAYSRAATGLYAQLYSQWDA